MAVAYASREAARIAVAPVDARGAHRRAELIDLPALPRAARIAAITRRRHRPRSFVAHDDGVSMS